MNAVDNARRSNMQSVRIIAGRSTSCQGKQISLCWGVHLKEQQELSHERGQSRQTLQHRQLNERLRNQPRLLETHLDYVVRLIQRLHALHELLESVLGRRHRLDSEKQWIGRNGVAGRVRSQQQHQLTTTGTFQTSNTQHQHPTTNTQHQHQHPTPNTQH